ncbi:hypothetical protein V6N13_024522 [Hibiscus sabdariffa]
MVAAPAPSDTTCATPNGCPSGQPPKAIPSVSSSVSLEQLASSSPLKGQNVLKKGRNQSDEGVVECAFAMDAEDKSIAGGGTDVTHGEVGNADNTVLEFVTTTWVGG